MKARQLEQPARFKRGAQVAVVQPGIITWTGTVLTVKPSTASGWWYEVDRHDGGGCHSVTEDLLQPLPGVEPGPHARIVLGGGPPPPRRASRQRRKAPRRSS